MKVITIWQPWASLITYGHKQIETRSWPTRYRGEILIHSAKKSMKDIERTHQVDCDLIESRLGVALESLPYGYIIGKAEIIDCIEITRDFVNTLAADERAFGNYEIGRYAWILKNPVLFSEPIQAKGFQGLWNYKE